MCVRNSRIDLLFTIPKCSSKGLGRGVATLLSRSFLVSFKCLIVLQPKLVGTCSYRTARLVFIDRMIIKPHLETVKLLEHSLCTFPLQFTSLPSALRLLLRNGFLCLACWRTCLCLQTFYLTEFKLFRTYLEFLWRGQCIAISHIPTIAVFIFKGVVGFYRDHFHASTMSA